LLRFARLRQLKRYAANRLMKDKKLNIEVLSEHESGVRRMVSDSTGIPYQALHSLDEAKTFADGIVVLEGDDGGQIYVVCPASLVLCSAETLGTLLRDLDAIAWPGNDFNSARVFYERLPVGAPVFGGKGGAMVSTELWIHDEFEESGIDVAVREVIAGQRTRIGDAA
jgi:hypothetical protein